MTIVLGLGIALFGVPVRGSLVDLYLASAFFIAATLALGLLISTAARSQFQSMQMIMFFFLPNILLSGFMFPFEGMPRAAQILAEFLPSIPQATAVSRPACHSPTSQEPAIE